MLCFAIKIILFLYILRSVELKTSFKRDDISIFLTNNPLLDFSIRRIDQLISISPVYSEWENILLTLRYFRYLTIFQVGYVYVTRIPVIKQHRFACISGVGTHIRSEDRRVGQECVSTCK